MASLAAIRNRFVDFLNRCRTVWVNRLRRIVQMIRNACLTAPIEHSASLSLSGRGLIQRELDL
jgi:hypothetical protein